MSYNSLRFPDASGEERKEYFKKIFAFVHPDILIMQEVGNINGADTLLSILNSNENKYLRADFVDDGAMNSVLFYNENLFQFIQINQIFATPRKINEYVLETFGKELRCYSCHLRASTGEENEQERLTAVTNLRNYLSQLSEGTEFVVVGDMNFYTSSEPAYQKLIGEEENNIGRCRDLCTLIGDWHDNEEFAPVHTQSPRVEFFNGGIGGGLDDKFDFIFVSYNFNDNQNIEYIEDSFTTVGNDGNHFNQSVNFGENSAVPSEIADALYYASDHLPVYADFTIDNDFIGLISPNGGENWFSGQTYQIRWETSIQNPFITIKLIKYNPYQETILAEDVNNPDSWNWTIPQNILPGSDYKIYVETDNLSDISRDYFSINYQQPEDVIFFSEYVEGSSYNKALEIFNPTEHDINLENYVLKKQTNGSGDFSSDFTIPAFLSSNQVIVIAHPSACEEILQVADYTSSTLCNFNGNDAIGLFKDDELIDLIGFIDTDEYWGKDKTLVRKPYISVPSDSFNITEWNEYPIDTFSFLGSHLYDPSYFYNNDIEPYFSIVVYPNPYYLKTKGNINFITDFNLNLFVKISLYNLKGEKIFEIKKIKNKKIEIPGMAFKNSGIYIYVIETVETRKAGKITIIK